MLMLAKKINEHNLTTRVKLEKFMSQFEPRPQSGEEIPPELGRLDRLGNVLTADELERLKGLMSGWRIDSWVSSKGSGKTFTRTIPVPEGAHEEYTNRLYHRFFDEPHKKDPDLIEIFGGYEVADYSRRDFQYGEVEVVIDTIGGPITMDDVKQVLRAEEYLRLSGYLLPSDPYEPPIGAGRRL